MASFRLPRATSLVAPVDPLMSRNEIRASVATYLEQKQDCYICQRSVSGLFSRILCRQCHQPVCAEHVKETTRDLRAVFVCDRCYKAEMMDAHDLQLEMVANVLRLRLYAFEKERDKLTQENVVKEAKLQDQGIRLSSLASQLEKSEDIQVTIDKTSLMAEKLTKAKSDYAALIGENTELEDTLKATLGDEESVRQDTLTAEEHNQDLATSVIEHARVLDKRIPLHQLKGELCPKCYKQVRKEFHQHFNSANLAPSEISSVKVSSEGKRCLFC